MIEPLAQQILDLIYHDSKVRRPHKDSLANWILDTQPRTEPLDTKTLLQYLALHQSDVLSRLKINVQIKHEIAQALREADPGQIPRG
jgi:hypothetical protein